MSEYDGSVRISLNIDTKDGKAELQKIGREIVATSKKIEDAKAQQQKAKLPFEASEKVSKYASQLKAVEAEYKRLLGELNELKQVQIESNLKGGALEASNQLIAEQSNKVEVARQKWESLQVEYRKSQEELRAASKAYKDTEKTAKDTVAQEQQNLTALIEKYNKLKSERVLGAGERIASHYQKEVGEVAPNAKSISKAKTMLTSIGKEIAKTTEKVSKLEAKMRDIGSASTQKVPTTEYTELLEKLQQLESELAVLKEKKKQFLLSGGESGSKEFERMNAQISNVERSITYAKGDLADLVELGKAFKLNTTDGQKLAEQLSEAQGKLAQLTDTYNQSAKNIRVAEEQMARSQKQTALTNRIKSMIPSIKQLTSSLKKVKSVLKSVSNATTKLMTFFPRMAVKAISATRKIASQVKKMNTVLNGALKPLRKMLSLFGSLSLKGVGSFKNITKHSKTSGNMITKFGNRVLGLAKRAFVFNLISKLFRSMVTGISDGIDNYIEKDEELKKSVNELKVSINSLKANFGSVFGQLLQIAMPVLKQIISWMNKATNAVASFVAAMSGKSTYKKAIDNVDSIKDSTDAATESAKELKKELASYDKLKVISQDTDTSTSDSNDNDGLNVDYEDVDVSSSIAEFAEKLKTAWETADFTEIGNTIGTKLKDGLDAIPWDDLNTNAQNVGTSLATLINGFVETSGLGTTIGNTVGNLLNTGVAGCTAFMTALDWKDVGTFVADAVNGFVQTADWSGVGNAIALGINGVTDFTNTLLTTAKFDAIAKAIATVVNTAVENTKWDNVGTAIANGINALTDFSNTLVKNAKFGKIAKAITTVINTAVKDTNWDGIGTAIANGINALTDFSGTLVATANFDAIAKSIATVVNTAVKGTSWTGIGTAIANGINAITDFSTTLGRDLDLSTMAESIATVVNTAVGGTSWTGIGSAVAGGINGASKLVTTWNQTFDFSKLGEKVASVCNDLFAEKDTWTGIGTAMASGINSVVTLLSTWENQFDFKNFGIAFASGINSFFKSTDWDTAGTTLSGVASGILTSIESAIDTLNWESIGSAVGDMLSGLSWTDLLTGAASVVVGAFSGLLDFAGAVKTKLTGDEWDNIVLGASTASKDLENINTQVDALLANKDDWKTAGDAEADYASSLADEYFDLASNLKDTVSNKTKMKQLASKLVATLPDLEKYYSKETGYITATKAEVEALIEDYRKKAKLQAIENNLTDYYSSQLEQEVEIEINKEDLEGLKKAEQGIRDKISEYNEKLRTASGATRLSYSRKVGDLNDQLSSNLKQQEKTQATIDAAQEKYDKVEKQINVLIEAEEKIEESGTDWINGSSVSTTATTREEKIKVIAQVTGVDYTNLPVTDKYIDDCYAQIASAEAEKNLSVQIGTANAKKVTADLNATLTTGVKASSVDANGNKLTTGVKANSVDANGNKLTTGVKANSVDANGNKLTTGVKASSIDKNGQDVTTNVKASSIDSNKHDVTTGITGNKVALATGVSFLTAITGSSVGLAKGIKFATTIFGKKVRLNDGIKFATTVFGKKVKLNDGIKFATTIFGKKVKLNDGIKFSTHIYGSKVSLQSKIRFATHIYGSKVSLNDGVKFQTSVFAKAIEPLKNVYLSATAKITKISPLSDQVIKDLESVFTVTTAAQKKKKDGGVYSNGKWSDIAQYASGGLPNHGTVFVAGEAGAEVVGNVGGRTEVLNKSQIASAIYSAVVSAMNSYVSAIGTTLVNCTNALISNISNITNMLNAIRYGNVATAANYQTSTYNYIPDSVKINIIREGVNASNAFTASNATSLIDTLANKIGDKIGSGNYTFIAQLDGKTIFKETVSQNKMYKSQTGRSAFL